MPSTPDQTVTIGDEVYTLDGLIIAYKRQLDQLKHLEDEKVGEILEARLSSPNSWSLWSRLVSMITNSPDVRSELVREFQQDESFTNRLCSQIIEVVKGRILMEIDATFARKEAVFWQQREENVKALIRELLATQERLDGLRLRDLQHTLAEALKTPITEAVDIALKQATPDPEAEERARAAREAELKLLMDEYHQRLMSQPGPVQPPIPDTHELPLGWSVTPANSI